MVTTPIVMYLEFFILFFLHCMLSSTQDLNSKQDLQLKGSLGFSQSHMVANTRSLQSSHCSVLHDQLELHDNRYHRSTQRPQVWAQYRNLNRILWNSRDRTQIQKHRALPLVGIVNGSYQCRASHMQLMHS